MSCVSIKTDCGAVHSLLLVLAWLFSRNQSFFLSIFLQFDSVTKCYEPKWSTSRSDRMTNDWRLRSHFPAPGSSLGSWISKQHSVDIFELPKQHWEDLQHCITLFTRWKGSCGSGVFILVRYNQVEQSDELPAFHLCCCVYENMKMPPGLQ